MILRNLLLILTGLLLSSQQNALAGDSLSPRDRVRTSSAAAPGRAHQEALRQAQIGTIALMERRAALQRSPVDGLPGLQVAILSQGRRIALGTLVSSRGYVVAKYSLLPAVGGPSLSGRLASGLAAPLSLAAISEMDDLALLHLTFASGAPALPAIRFSSGLPASGTVLRASVGTNGLPAFGTVAACQRPVLGSPLSPSHLRTEAIRQHANANAYTRQPRQESVEMIEANLSLAPEHCGAPVFDPRDCLVGVAMIRNGGSSVYVVPSGRIRALLATYEQKSH